MTITGQPPTVEYRQVTSLDNANDLAAQGWQLHSVVAFGSNVWYVMQRQTGALAAYRAKVGGDLADRLREQAAQIRSRPPRAGMERDRSATPAEPDRVPTLVTVLGELADCTTAADAYTYAYGVIAATCRGWHAGATGDALGRIAAVVLVCDQKVEALAARSQVADAAHEEADTRRYATGVLPVDAEWIRAQRVWKDAEQALTAQPGAAVPQSVRDAVDTLGGLLAIWHGCGED